jgi:coenzyme F420 hydrogenase subunit beta
MGGDGEQWLIVRNSRGEMLLDLIAGEARLAAPSSSGRRAGAVRGFVANVQRAAGGLPVRRTPRWLRPLLAILMPRIGPRGLEFARARVEMKAAETVLHLARKRPRLMRHLIPPHVWTLVAPYGLDRRAERRPGRAASAPRGRVSCPDGRRHPEPGT